MRGPQRPRHGGLVDPALPRGGGARGGARLEVINREKNSHKVEYSASLVTLKLGGLVSAPPRQDAMLLGS
eukprot:5928182-Pyramimonas_sp.AAC.1